MSRPSSPAGRSYSLGTSQFKDGSSSVPTPSGQSFASGSKSPTSSKPEGSSVYSALSRAQAVEESRARFQQATIPKPAYRDAAGGEHKIDPADQEVQTLRKTVTPDKYADRPARAQDFYGPQPGGAPPVVYRDPFGPLFHWWLLERASADRRAAWAYHHRGQIDQARWADMTRRDPQLESRVRQLETAGQPRDPNYVPPELANDRDLMYSDEYLAAVGNPQPQQAGGPTSPEQSNSWDRFVARGPQAEAPQRRTSLSWTAVFASLAMLGLGAFVVWLVFIRQFPEPGTGNRHDRGKKTMPTLFQIVKNALLGRSAARRSDETAIYNPLSARCGAFVAIDAIDFRGKNYRIAEIQQYDHNLGGKRFPFANYVLRFDEEVVRLRAIPLENRWKALLLTLYDDLAYNEGLHNVVRDDTLKFVVDDPEKNLHEEYWRVEDVRESYKAQVTILRGTSPNTPSEVSRAQVEYWDYWRDTEVDSVKVTQYLYVEMNTETGWFQIWRGTETDPERILLT